MNKNDAEYIVSKCNIFSISDDIYIRMSLLSSENPYEMERIRRKFLKYKEKLSLLPEMKGMMSILAQKILDFKPFDENFDIKKQDGYLFIRTPRNESIIAEIKSIRGCTWQNPYIKIPVENGIRGIKAVEKVFGVFIDYDVVDACYAVIGVKTLEKSLKMVVLFPDDSVKKFLDDFPMYYNNSDSSYLYRIEDEIRFQNAVVKVLATKGKIRFVHGSEAKMSEIALMFADEKKRSKELANLSFSASTENQIKYPNGVVPYPYQLVGVEFIEKTGARTLIADEMGLGKTCQVAIYFYNHPDALPSVVICPSSVKINWSRELFRFANIDLDDIQIVEGAKETDSNKISQGKKVYIVNYDILKDRVDDLYSISYKSIIIDEAQYIKNSKTKRTKAVFKLVTKTNKIICLSGTPIMNKPIDIWNIIEVTKNGGHFGGFWSFATRYCGAFKAKYGWDMSGATNLDDLHRKLREKMMIRRLKEHVLTELPPKIRSIIPIEITNRAKYSRAFSDFKQWYLKETKKEIKKAEALVKIEMLKQIICDGKKMELGNFIEDAFVNNKKVIVFFTHNDFLFDMNNELSRDITLLRVTSDQNSEKRQEIIDDFNDRDECVLLCTIGTAGRGLNIQTATTVIFAELGWTPADHKQAEDRAHRIGQRSTVNIYYIVAANTIEEKIMEIIKKKQSMIDESVGDENMDIKDDLFRWFDDS